VIPPGGVHALVIAAWVVVLGLAVVNAERGEWGLAINGAMLATGLSVVLATLRRPPKA
jgi:hypothetical protein